MAAEPARVSPSTRDTRSGQSSLARNVTSNWLGMGLSIVYALIITPIVIGALDKQMYGAWSFLNGLLAYSELFYLGLGSAIIRYVAQARITNDLARINRLASVVLTIYAAIGLTVLVVLTSVSGRMTTIFPDQLAPELAQAITYTVILLGVRVLLIFVTSGFSGLLAAHDRFDMVNGVNIASLVVKFVTIPWAISMGSNPLLTFAWLMCAATALEAIAMASIAFWYIPNLSIRPSRPTAAELRLLYGFGLQSFFILVAFKLISYTDTAVITTKLGLVAAGLYTPALQVVEYARMFVGGLAGVLLPRLTAHATQNDLPALRHDYLRSARVGFFVAGWLGAGVISLGPAFLTRWVGPDFGNASQMVLVWLTVASLAQSLSTQVPYPFYQALNMVAIPAAVLTVEGVMNLVLSIWLAPKMGLEGVALATAIPAVIVSLAVLPVYLCRRLELPLSRLVLEGAVPGLLMLAASLAAILLIRPYVPTDSYVAIVLVASVTAPIALAAFMATFPREERQTILGLIRIRR